MTTTTASNDDISALRAGLGRAPRWVVKIGSALTTNQGLGLNSAAIEDWAAQMVELKRAGRDIVVVTSGSVAEGAARLGWKKRPHSLHQLQAAAAIGQMGLVRAWERAYEKYGMRAAQVLLTHLDLADRQRYLNARSTLWTLLNLDVLPVVNENDTVATEEIRLGDNDALAGLVSNLIDADLMVILTDQEGLMTGDPRVETNARIIPYAKLDAADLDRVAGGSGEWGRGGMRTKLEAAKLAARSATATIIASGLTANVLLEIAAGKEIGTLLVAADEKLAARKQWLAGPVRANGRLILDVGACRVIREHGRSLLPVGVTDVSGDFGRGALVSCVDPEGREVARGLVNYTSAEVRAIKSLPSEQIESKLGFAREPELIHRDNLVII
jgi:glutamate 5-kinase